MGSGSSPGSSRAPSWLRGCSSPSAFRPTVAPTIRRHRPPSSRSRARRSSSSRSRLGDPVLQAGVVRDGEVILARGLEVDIARNLAKRLGIPHVRFVYVKPASRLLVADGASLGSHDRLDQARPRGVGHCRSQRPVPRHRSGGRAAARPAAADDARRPSPQDHLRRARERRRPGDRRPGRAAREADSRVARTSGCSSSSRRARATRRSSTPIRVGQFVAGRGGILGPVSARVEVGGGYVVGVTRGGPIAVSEVDRALARMRADGTMHRLARQWLGIDPARLRPLR